jgi:hypothetical protein
MLLCESALLLRIPEGESARPRVATGLRQRDEDRCGGRDGHEGRDCRPPLRPHAREEDRHRRGELDERLGAKQAREAADLRAPRSTARTAIDVTR